jgi:hypothetical protein
MSNKRPRKLDPVAEVLNTLIYQFGVQGLVLNALIDTVSKEIPNSKEKMIAFLAKLEHPKLLAQAMIDEAIDYVRKV